MAVSVSHKDILNIEKAHAHYYTLVAEVYARDPDFDDECSNTHALYQLVTLWDASDSIISNTGWIDREESDNEL